MKSVTTRRSRRKMVWRDIPLSWDTDRVKVPHLVSVSEAPEWLYSLTGATNPKCHDKPFSRADWFTLGKQGSLAHAAPQPQDLLSASYPTIKSACTRSSELKLDGSLISVSIVSSPKQSGLLSLSLRTRARANPFPLPSQWHEVEHIHGVGWFLIWN